MRAGQSCHAHNLLDIDDVTGVDRKLFKNVLTGKYPKLFYNEIADDDTLMD